jgi:hypothetical protein
MYWWHDGDGSEFKVGDLVVYSEPRRFFVKEEEATMLGLITEITTYFARVLWSDGLWCLESFEDIEKIN